MDFNVFLRDLISSIDYYLDKFINSNVSNEMKEEISESTTEFVHKMFNYLHLQKSIQSELLTSYIYKCKTLPDILKKDIVEICEVDRTNIYMSFLAIGVDSTPYIIYSFYKRK